MARPVGKLGPVPAVRGLGFWAPERFPSSPDLNTQLIPFDWGVPYGPVGIFQTWTFSTNPNLLPPTPPATGQPLPFDWGTPEGPQPLLQTWTFSLPVAFYPAVQAPFAQDDWPLPTPYPRLDQTWTRSYNLNLIGQDQLPSGEQTSDLPPRPYPPPGLTWIQSFELPVFQQLPTGVEVTELSPRAYPEPATRTWAFAFNLNLIGQDRLPSGDQFYDLWPKPYEFSNLFRTWSWSRNLNLIAQDAMVTGEQVFDLSPKGLEYPISLRTWIAYSPLAFIPAAAPFAQDDWPVPKAPAPIQQSWAWTYNYNLIAQDAMITGEQVYDLAPRPYPEPATRTWAAWFNLNLIGRDRMLAGKQSYDLAPIAPPQILPRSWTWTYNPNLTGQDQLPTGVQRYDLAPVGPFYATQLRTWIYFTPPTPTFAIPFNQFDWPTPKPYPEPATRTWAASYNLNLIGQDSMLVGKQVSDLSPIAQPQILPRSWTLNLQQSTLQPIPYGDQWWERPPLGPIQPLREWTWRYNLNLVAQDAMITGKQVYDLAPIGYTYPTQLRTWIDKRPLPLDFVAGIIPYINYDWPVPKGPPPPDRFYNFSFPKVLRGQDTMVPGEQVTDLSPRDHLRLGQLRVWFERFNPNLVGKDVLPAGDQYYEFPRPPLQPTSIFVATYNKNLVGKDQLPTGDQYFDLSPRGPITPRDVINWISTVNLALKFPGVAPVPRKPFDWPLPVGWTQDTLYPSILRTFISGANLCIGIPFPIPPIPTPPTGPQFVHNPGNEWQIYDRIREPGPVGWR